MTYQFARDASGKRSRRCTTDNAYANLEWIIFLARHVVLRKEGPHLQDVHSNSCSVLRNPSQMLRSAYRLSGEGGAGEAGAEGSPPEEELGGEVLRQGDLGQVGVGAVRAHDLSVLQVLCTYVLLR